MTLGRDGLVINTAKYLDGQPLVAFNPDPQRIDGVLIPFSINEASAVLHQVLFFQHRVRRLTMAKATLNDGQKLYAVNDLFIGQRTQVSAYYHIRLGEDEEDQCSSGLIVSTGAGSTGWLRGVMAGVAGVLESLFPAPASQSRPNRHPQERQSSVSQLVREHYAFDATAELLNFVVREPFVTQRTSARIVNGQIGSGERLEIVSQMPQNGVIFSDGIESDFLHFNSGAIASIAIAEKKVALVVP